MMKTTHILTITLCILPLWWIFQVLWLPSTMHILAGLSYRSVPLKFSQATATSARNRAYAYATRGGSASDDIYFTKDEVSHLLDVNRVYSPVSMIVNLLAVVSWSILLLSVYKKADFHEPLRVASKILALFVGVLFLCLTSFGLFFEQFHRLLFPQGNWAFPADSLLITLFPETFWKLEVFSMLVFLCLFGTLYWTLKSKFQRRVD